MKTAGVADLKAHLSRYLERVKAGQEVTITERGLPVAKLVPFERAGQARSRRDRLVRAGLLLPGRGKVRAQLLKPPVGDPALGRSVLEALVEERREDR
jgi:prevent-host-death family protein